jgi:antitoxin (DNA-binding transcriptional repressor) of toxin-antitoxin stability system
LALWLFGSLALWLFGSLALWLFGSLALWLFGSLALAIGYHCCRVTNPRCGPWRRTLPPHLGEYLDRARAGDTIVITGREVSVVRLPGLTATMERLAAAGGGGAPATATPDIYSQDEPGGRNRYLVS